LDGKQVGKDLSRPWRKKQEQLFDGKIVIDAMNPYSENFEIMDLGNSTSITIIVILKTSIKMIFAHR
jgi:predicted dinucleotide-binding enzyme